MNQPLLSIVICTYNRDSYLQKCLEHLSNQTSSSDQFEILVVNNQSSDATEEVCLHFQQEHPKIHFLYIIEPRQGLSFCRNRGIEESGGEIISYLDDDAYANRDYAANLIDYFQEHREVDAIGGKITPEYENQEPPWMSHFLLPLVAALDKGNSAKPFVGSEFPIGANMAFRRSLFNESEPFHTDLGRKGGYLGSGEEKDLFLRLKKQNHTIHYVPNIQVKHSIPDSRLEIDYVKRMAKGIGESEAVRIKKSPFHQVLGKWIQEFFKIGATIILAISYILKGKWPKASMLIKFRIWLLGSFIRG